MSDKWQWICVAILVAAIFTVLFVFYTATEPNCPVDATKVFTRSGWYCTVPPLR